MLLSAVDPSSDDDEQKQQRERFDPKANYRLPQNYEAIGTALIQQAGAKCGAAPDALEIQWKAGRIVVIVRSDRVYVSGAGGEEGEEEDDYDDDDDDGIEVDDEDEDEDEFEEELEKDDDELEKDDEDEGSNDDDEEDEKEVDEKRVVDEEEEGNDSDDDDEKIQGDDSADDEAANDGGIDVSAVARAINAALDDDGLNGGWAIAQSFEIEVTTPGASDELQGIMFQAYKGFDVICAFSDLKKKDKGVKEITGKLVERTDQYVKLNIKGRMKSIRNDQIVSVKLPKAKKEKGAR
jgi:hypothetical protein